MFAAEDDRDAIAGSDAPTLLICAAPACRHGGLVEVLRRARPTPCTTRLPTPVT